MTSDSDMRATLPTNLWMRQQQFAGLTAQGLVGTIDCVAANDPTKKPKHAEIAARLIAGMERAGIRPADIVSELKVDKETVRLWMRGERMARDQKLERLAKMIGMSAGDLRYGKKTARELPHLQGELVTDEDELRLLSAYRGLRKDWAREALRRRAVELLEEFGEPGVANPFKSHSGTQ